MQSGRYLGGYVGKEVRNFLRENKVFIRKSAKKQTLSNSLLDLLSRIYEQDGIFGPTGFDDRPWGYHKRCPRPQNDIKYFIFSGGKYLYVPRLEELPPLVPGLALVEAVVLALHPADDDLGNAPPEKSRFRI